jgi:L-iditol 2-dehydrogenase
MKALLLSQYRRLEIVNLATPEPAPDEVLVQIAACGVCGSDVHGYDGTSGRRIPPIVMGHEAAGKVASVGSRVVGLSPGDSVTFDSTIFCGQCHDCLRGKTNLCDHRQVLGVSCTEYRRPGAFAEYIAVPQRIVHHLPREVSFAEAAMLEPAAVALHAVAHANLGSDSTVLVLGAGMIGLLILQSVRAAGCSRVVVADLDSSRLALASQLGAVQTIHTSGEALVSQLQRETNTAGVDVVFEAVGVAPTVQAAIACVRKGGQVILVGNLSAQVPLPLQSVVTRQIQLQGSCASAGEYPEAIRMLASGTIKVRPLITAVASLDEGPSWFERLHSGEPNLMKVVLVPGAMQ